jgi:hypothetical protein
MRLRDGFIPSFSNPARIPIIPGLLLQEIGRRIGYIFIFALIQIIGAPSAWEAPTICSKTTLALKLLQ